MAQTKKKILVVEDETKIAEIVKVYLEKADYAVFLAEDGEQGLSLFYKIKPDLILLDLMLPKISGENVCKTIRQISRVPIIMLTAKSNEDDTLSGFSIGADDYVRKPFSPRELLARVHSVLRRSHDAKTPLYNQMDWNDGDLLVDFASGNVTKKGVDLKLTPSEFKILSILAKYPRRTFTREELIDAVWGHDFDGFERAIDSHVKNLRGKIEDNSAEPQYILTIRGVGYAFGGEVKKDRVM